MPLIIEGGRVPSRWADRKNSSSVMIDSRVARSDGLKLALINNMPDSALEDTELQFFNLLDCASEDIAVYIKLFSLAGVPRTDRGQRHLNSFYYPFEELWQNRFDAVIVTGTEPRHANLRDEPYWNLLTQVFDWAECNTTSTILSCLAAHASVLYYDGVKRHALPDKKFGVFDSTKVVDHPLVSKVAGELRFPHSRWNEVREDELTATGHLVLTKSAGAGVDLFVKQMKRSLFVHFQGHPEYGAQTLAKEYKRDIKRFLRHERETFPSMPHGYFGQAEAEVLIRFQESAQSDRCEEMIESFPESVFAGLQRTWQLSASTVYRNWLYCIGARRAERPSLMGFRGIEARRSRVAMSNDIA